MVIINNTDDNIYFDATLIPSKSSYECVENMYNTVNIHSEYGSCVIITEYSKRTITNFGNIKVVELEDKDDQGMPVISITNACKYTGNDIEKLRANSRFLNSSPEELQELHDFMGAMDRNMRDATLEESKSVHDYVESISKPTGVTFDDATDNVIYVDVLGARYKIIKSNMVEYPQLERMAGYCDFNIHTIVVDEFKNPDQDATADMDAYKNKVLRHELVHAFLRESGLSVNSWANNEEIVDWIAIQAPKILQVFKDLDVL